MRAQLLVKLRISLKLNSRAKRNYLEPEGPPYLPSVPVPLPPYSIGGKLSVKYQRNYNAHRAAARKIPLQWAAVLRITLFVVELINKRNPKMIVVPVCVCVCV